MRVKRAYVIAAIALAAVCATITVYAVGGHIEPTIIPIPSDQETKSVWLPPNVEKVNVYQAGQYSVEVSRIKILNADSVVNDQGQIVGFNIELLVKSPSTVDASVSVKVTLFGGNEVSASKDVELSPGKNVVYIALPKPVNPDDVVSISISAVPK